MKLIARCNRYAHYLDDNNNIITYDVKIGDGLEVNDEVAIDKKYRDRMIYNQNKSWFCEIIYETETDIIITVMGMYVFRYEKEEEGFIKFYNRIYTNSNIKYLINDKNS